MWGKNCPILWTNNVTPTLCITQQVLSLPLFETASQGCQKSISLKIKTTFCAPDEFLVHKGDVLHSIFYLSNGSMEVLQDGMVVAILGGFLPRINSQQVSLNLISSIL